MYNSVEYLSALMSSFQITEYPIGLTTYRVVNKIN